MRERDAEERRHCRRLRRRRQPFTGSSPVRLQSSPIIICSGSGSSSGRRQATPADISSGSWVCLFPVQFRFGPRFRQLGQIWYSGQHGRPGQAWFSQRSWFSPGRV